MNSFGIANVLVAVDLSESDIPALRYARLIADRFSAKLTVMDSDPIVDPVDFVGPVQTTVLSTAMPEHLAKLRTSVEQHARPLMAGREYDIQVTMGQPTSAILLAASEREADLIVVGTHLRHGWRRAGLGSVSEGVLHGSRCPVLTVGAHDRVGAGPCAVTNVLCPVNFTDVARDSLRAAARVADAFGARLVIVHVIEPDEVTDVAAAEDKVRHWIAPELQGICSYRELVLRGGAAERVLDCADDVGADLIVVGAQHKFLRNATVIGTTAERIIRFASCPVLVVPRQAVPDVEELEKSPALVTAER